MSNTVLTILVQLTDKTSNSRQRNSRDADLPTCHQARRSFARQAYWVEHGFRRVQGHLRSLPPTYLQRADHRTGLICRLTIGLRRLTLLECVVRWQLAQEPRTLTGLDAGNPKRTTGRPTAEQLLTALGNLPLTISDEGAQLRHHLTPRSTLQQRILPLLGLSSLIYTNLAFDSS